MGTRFLTPKDLDMARLWARLETIIPYRYRRLPHGDVSARLRFYWQHLPHFLVRQYCRTYVWFRKLQQRTASAVPSGTSAEAVSAS
jgi:hypothetical protein